MAVSSEGIAGEELHGCLAEHLLVGLILSSVSPVPPLVFIGDPSGMFVSGLTLKFSLSCTVIPGCVLCGHRAKLQVKLVLGLVSGDGDAALEGWAVVSASITPCVSHPLMALPWRPVDPSPEVTTGFDGVSRDSIGERQN
jgi:hypothetical protein